MFVCALVVSCFARGVCVRAACTEMYVQDRVFAVGKLSGGVVLAGVLEVGSTALEGAGLGRGSMTDTMMTDTWEGGVHLGMRMAPACTGSTYREADMCVTTGMQKVEHSAVAAAASRQQAKMDIFLTGLPVARFEWPGQPCLLTEPRE